MAKLLDKWKNRKKNSTKEDVTMICTIEFRTAKVRIIHGIFLAMGIILSLFCLLPVLWMMLSAFKDTREFLQVPATLLPKSYDFSKITTVWVERRLGRTFINTILMAAGDVISCVLVSGLAGYVLSRLKPRGSKLFFTVILWTMMMPSQGTAVPLFMTFTDFPIFHFNMSGTFWPMWLMAGANAYYILLFKSYFDSLSISFFESAKIDGCTDFGMFFRLVVPLSIPVMCVIMVFQFNNAWGNFFWPYLLLADSDWAVLGQKLFVLKSQVTIDTYVMTLAIATVPPALLYFFFQKQIMGGLTVGGVKG